MSRVQITPCRVNDESVLLVQPDAHLLDNDNGRGKPTQSIQRSVSSKHSAKIPLAKLSEWYAAGQIDDLRQYIVDVIQPVWNAAQSFRPADFKRA